MLGLAVVWMILDLTLVIVDDGNTRFEVFEVNIIGTLATGSDKFDKGK